MDANGDPTPPPAPPPSTSPGSRRPRPQAKTTGPNGNGSTPTAQPANEHATEHATGQATDLRAEAGAAVVRLLELVGEDPEREGLQGTPERVVKALLELTEGYEQDPAEILSTVFEEDYEDVVLVRKVPFSSLCEHHLLPIQGHATVAYRPQGGVVGLSKISRLVQALARRLQVQERMTREIAQAIDEHLSPRGVAVLIEAEHACMGMRGVRTPATMVTTEFRGAFTDPAEQQRFLTQAHQPSQPHQPNDPHQPDQPHQAGPAPPGGR